MAPGVAGGLADRVQVDATIENSSPDYLAEKNARECRQLPRAWQFQTRRRQRRTNAPNASRMRARTECDYRRKYAGLRRSLPTVTVSRVANDHECKRKRVAWHKLEICNDQDSTCKGGQAPAIQEMVGGRDAPQQRTRFGAQGLCQKDTARNRPLAQALCRAQRPAQVVALSVRYVNADILYQPGRQEAAKKPTACVGARQG